MTDAASRPTEQQLLLQNVEELLKCKVCQKRITPPVVVCRKGHCICKQCNPTSYMCPVCNKFLISDNFVMLETLLNTLPRHCRHFRHGCKKIIPGDSSHDKYCLERPKKCELGMDNQCGWTGNYKEWLDHIKTAFHCPFTFWNTEGNILFVQYYNFTSPWENYNLLLRFEMSVFLLFAYKSEEFLHMTVKYLGQYSQFAMQMPQYTVKITFLRDTTGIFSIELNSEDDILAMCEDIPLNQLIPLVNTHGNQELDMFVELKVENLPHILDLEDA